jgi:hypothetical protein
MIFSKLWAMANLINSIKSTKLEQCSLHTRSGSRCLGELHQETPEVRVDVLECYTRKHQKWESMFGIITPGNTRRGVDVWEYYTKKYQKWESIVYPVNTRSGSRCTGSTHRWSFPFWAWSVCSLALGTSYSISLNYKLYLQMTSLMPQYTCTIISEITILIEKIET